MKFCFPPVTMNTPNQYPSVHMNLHLVGFPVAFIMPAIVQLKELLAGLVHKLCCITEYKNQSLCVTGVSEL